MSEKAAKREKQGKSTPDDPFAFDIFSEGPSQQGDRIALTSVKQRPLPKGVTRDWYTSLPELPAASMLIENSVPQEPEWLDETVNLRLLPRFKDLLLENEVHGDFRTLSFEQVEPSSIRNRLDEGENVFVRIRADEWDGVLAFSSDLASSIIDTVLGVTPGSNVTPRPLSPIELAIIEYLSAVILSELNNSKPHKVGLRLLEVTNETPEMAWSMGKLTEIVGDLALGDTSGMFTFVLENQLVEHLNSVFLEKQAVVDSMIERLAAYIGEPRLRLEIGATSVPAADIPYLEPSDVVICSDPVAAWWDGRVTPDRMSCSFGRPGGLEFEGKFEEEGHHFEMFRLEKTVIADPGAIRRISDESLGQGGDRMDNEEEVDVNEGGDRVGPQSEDLSGLGEGIGPEGDLVALESVMVDLRVFVAGRKISLTELGGLRAGQLIDLGCRPEDPVELVAENSNKPIASGELVKVGDQLGVRILKVFV